VHYAVQPAAVYLLGLVMGQERARTLAELEQWSNPLVQAMPPLSDWPAVALFAALVCGLVPLAEEVFFRGLAYQAARRRLHPGWAAGLVALAFAAVHLQVVNFLPIAVLGWAFAVAVERTGSLVPAVAMHAVNNLVALVVAYTQR
ncbi:MAG: CPBP family intramembrane glutamic endopeptidase, partial [Armatimonadota bacterium]|nr:CPBP family intramembrane glutamic endopeptidase [Armatimonadota bacterium]